MKQLMVVVVAALFMSCNNGEGGDFKISGELKNAEDQSVYLEQLFFSSEPPVVVDSARLKDGKFVLETTAKDEGLYRIRFAEHDGFLIINDQEDIEFVANANDSTLHQAKINSPANASLKNFIITLDSIHMNLMDLDQQYQAAKGVKNDSLANSVQEAFRQSNQQYQDYLKTYIDTANSPIVSVFALSYAQDLDVETVKSKLKAIAAKYPENSSVKQVKNLFDNMAQAQQQAPRQGNVQVGQMAPDFTLPDVDGKPFSLSSLKGKWVLVDFWASWCGPCRVENPHVVEAYNRFKDQNFTVLGVSLDQDKDAWLQAIQDDQLAWKQISDLKFWNSKAAALYGVQAIPYNVLVDPSGKVVATELRGAELIKTLEKNL